METKKIRKLSGKLKTVKKIREKSGNFAKSSRKLKFLVFKKFNIRTSNLRSFGKMLST